MAIRNILNINENEEQLRKKSKPVTEFNQKLWDLLEDMKETMESNNGVGLAAVQIGILRRIFILNIPEEGYYELINPEIIATSGVQKTTEGCLSIPNVSGYTKRPLKVTVKAQNRTGKWYKLTGKNLLAKAICHENDHLNGIVFTDGVLEYVEN